MKTVLVLDNYDSFTYNLVHYLEALDAKVDVFRNDKIALEDVNKYDNIVLSPGPGIPSEAGILLPLIEKYASTKRILGVCLGHQAIGEVFGANLINLDRVYHGKARMTQISKDDYLFKNVSKEFETGRYHSWSLAVESVQDPLEIIAMDELGLVMGIRHKDFDVRGVQFHPESIMTPQGKTILQNWLTA